MPNMVILYVSSFCSAWDSCFTFLQYSGGKCASSKRHLDVKWLPSHSSCGHPIIMSKHPLDIPKIRVWGLLVDFGEREKLSPMRDFGIVFFFKFLLLWCHHFHYFKDNVFHGWCHTHSVQFAYSVGGSDQALTSRPDLKQALNIAVPQMTTGGWFQWEQMTPMYDQKKTNNKSVV